jgi:hypothetical protein
MVTNTQPHHAHHVALLSHMTDRKCTYCHDLFFFMRRTCVRDGVLSLRRQLADRREPEKLSSGGRVSIDDCGVCCVDGMGRWMMQRREDVASGKWYGGVLFCSGGCEAVV